MLYVFNFIVQVIILLGTFNFMVPLINCRTYLLHFVVIHIINFTLFVFPFRCTYNYEGVIIFSSRGRGDGRNGMKDSVKFLIPPGSSRNIVDPPLYL